MQTLRLAAYGMMAVILFSCSPVDIEQSTTDDILTSTPVTSQLITPTPEPLHETEVLRSYLGTPEKGEVATSVIELKEGGYLVSGYSYGGSGDISEWDALAMRISPDGNQVWMHTSDRSGSEYAWAVREGQDNQFVVVGTWEIENGSTNGYMQGIDIDGNELWFRTYGGERNEILWTAEPTPDGGFILAGQTTSEGAGNWDFYIVRTDSEGNEIWSKTYGTPVIDRAFGIGLTPDGGALIAGFSGDNPETMNFFFVRIDKDGREQWRRTIAGDRFDVAHDVLSLDDGGFVISGYTSSYGPGDYDGFLMRLSPDGRMLWMKTYGDKRDDRVLHVAQLEDGGFALVDYSNRDMTVWRVDSDGNLLWSYSDTGNHVSRGKDIIVTQNGSIVAVGGSRNSNPPNEDIILLILGEQ